MFLIVFHLFDLFFLFLKLLYTRAGQKVKRVTVGRDTDQPKFSSLSNEDNQNGSIACAVEVPVSGQADMDHKTNVTRQGSNTRNLSHADA